MNSRRRRLIVHGLVREPVTSARGGKENLDMRIVLVVLLLNCKQKSISNSPKYVTLRIYEISAGNYALISSSHKYSIPIKFLWKIFCWLFSLLKEFYFFEKYSKMYHVSNLWNFYEESLIDSLNHSSSSIVKLSKNLIFTRTKIHFNLVRLKSI